MFVEMMIIIPQVSYGAGRHVHYIEPKSNVVTGLHLNFVTQPLCLIGLCLTKVSVGLFLLRLTPSVRFRRLIWSVIIFTVLSSTGNFCELDCISRALGRWLTFNSTVTVFFQCKPLAFAWDHNIPGGECIPAGNRKFAAFFNSSSSTLSTSARELLANDFRRFCPDRSALRPPPDPHAMESPAQLEGQDCGSWSSIVGYLVGFLSANLRQ